MIRDDVDMKAFVGIWKLTEYKDGNGEDINRAYIFTRGVILDVRADGTLDFLDVDSLYYTFTEGGPEKCEWSFGDGYMRFRTEDSFWDNVGKIKDDVLILSYGANYITFVKDPNAFDDLDL